MPTRFDKYRVRDEITPLSERFLNPVFQDIDLRIAALEELEISWEAAVRVVTDFGLLRINEILAPTFVAVANELEQAKENRADIVALLGKAQGDIVALAQAIAQYQSDCDDQIAQYKQTALSELATWKQKALTELEGWKNALEYQLLSEATPPSDYDLIYDEQGRVSKLLETVAGERRETDFSYNPDGTVETAVSTYVGKQRTETYEYADGLLAGMTSEEIVL